jgi:hypothetical protein
MNNIHHVQTERVTAKTLDTIGWGLFFIWVGIAFLANVGWGVGLLGVGLIMIGAQVARTFFDMGVTAPMVLLGLRHGLGTMQHGLPLNFYKGHDLRRFSQSHNTLLYREIRGRARLPLRCVGVIRHSPELYKQILADDSLKTISGEQKESYSHLYAHLNENGFHCAHAVFQRLGSAIPVSPRSYMMVDRSSSDTNGPSSPGPPRPPMSERIPIIRNRMDATSACIAPFVRRSRWMRTRTCTKRERSSRSTAPTTTNADRIRPCTIYVPATTIAAIQPSHWPNAKPNCELQRSGDGSTGRSMAIEGPESLS